MFWCYFHKYWPCVKTLYNESSWEESNDLHGKRIFYLFIFAWSLPVLYSYPRNLWLIDVNAAACFFNKSILPKHCSFYTFCRAMIEIKYIDSILHLFYLLKPNELVQICFAIAQLMRTTHLYLAHASHWLMLKNKEKNAERKNSQEYFHELLIQMAKKRQSFINLCCL